MTFHVEKVTGGYICESPNGLGNKYVCLTLAEVILTISVILERTYEESPQSSAEVTKPTRT